MSAHTPGPWEVDSGMVQTAYDHTCKTPGCGVHIPIAWMDREPNNGTMPVERDANARLIAAAPKLLAACKLVRQWLDGTDYVLTHSGAYNIMRANLEEAIDHAATR